MKYSQIVSLTKQSKNLIQLLKHKFIFYYSIGAELSWTQKKKSLLKSIFWRILASLTTLLIVYMISSELKLAGAVMNVEVVLKMIIYYFHERIWSQVEM